MSKQSDIDHRIRRRRRVLILVVVTHQSYRSRVTSADDFELLLRE